VNDMRLKGGKRTLKPVELLSEIKSFRESNSDDIQTLEAELMILLTEISDQFAISLIPDFQVFAKKCGTLTNFRSFIESSLESEESETLPMFLERVIKKKINCNCEKDEFHVKESFPSILVFSFTKLSSVLIQNEILFCGVKLKYLSHLERNITTRSNFNWNRQIYGNEYENPITTSKFDGNNIRLIVFSPDPTEHTDLPKLSYNSKALNVFSKRARSFLNPEKAAEIKSHQRDYDHQRDKPEERRAREKNRTQTSQRKNRTKKKQRLQ
jgi:hypothetical protein